jgi:hypothetical protein
VPEAPAWDENVYKVAGYHDPVELSQDLKFDVKELHVKNPVPQFECHEGAPLAQPLTATNVDALRQKLQARLDSPFTLDEVRYPRPFPTGPRFAAEQALAALDRPNKAC